MESALGAQQTYNPWDDKRLWKVGADVFMLFMVFLASGYTVRKAMDYFIDPDASKIGEKNFQKKMEVGKNFVNEGIYKSREEISEEYQKLKPLSA